MINRKLQKVELASLTKIGVLDAGPIRNYVGTKADPLLRSKQNKHATNGYTNVSPPAERDTISTANLRHLEVKQRHTVQGPDDRISEMLLCSVVYTLFCRGTTIHTHTGAAGGKLEHSLLRAVHSLLWTRHRAPQSTPTPQLPGGSAPNYRHHHTSNALPMHHLLKRTLNTLVKISGPTTPRRQCSATELHAHRPIVPNPGQARIRT
eukprot:1011812-Amphidinium_carterae.1